MPKFDSQKWLSQNAPGYDKLNQGELNELTAFVFLWSLFEAKAFSAFASPSKIIKKFGEWKADKAEYSAVFAYFQARYSDAENGTRTLNARFPYLIFETKTDNPARDAIEKAIVDPAADSACKLVGMLMIVYRLRNNFFHGPKWAYEFRDQLDNFTHSNWLLATVLDELSK